MTIDKLFTGQRLDGTGLYFYGARYYDPLIGRFISPDTMVPDPASPQSFNRYSYCLNNPLKYTDPSGQTVYAGGMNVDFIYNIMENYGDWAQCYLEYYLNTPEFQAWDKYHNVWKSSSEYMETTKDKSFYVTSNYIPTQAEVKLVENGNELVRITTSKGTEIYDYKPDDGTRIFWRSGKGFTWETEGSWSKMSSSPPINWNKVGQKFTNANWGAVGNAFLGTFELVVGSPMAIVGTVLSSVVVIPGAAVAEVPLSVTGGLGYLGVNLCVDGINIAAGRQLIDIG